MLLNEQQLQCLSSPVRIQILEWLGSAGRASIAEIAKALSRSPHSLYHHMRKLEQVGLIVQEEQRKVGTQFEAVYAPTSRRLALNKSAQSDLYRVQVQKTVRLALRRAKEEFETYQAANSQEDQSQLLRVIVRLSEADQDELRSKLAELGNWARSKETEDGRPVAVTGLICPIER